MKFWIGPPTKEPPTEDLAGPAVCPRCGAEASVYRLDDGEMVCRNCEEAAS